MFSWKKKVVISNYLFCLVSANAPVLSPLLILFLGYDVCYPSPAAIIYMLANSTYVCMCVCMCMCVLHVCMHVSSLNLSSEL